jgi:cation diffusion facilitator family transporter
LDKTRALRLSSIAIVSVALFETVAGVIVNSLVILSDAAHATFDAITTIILLITTQWAMKPADEDHTYGHGKIESVGGLVGGIALIAVAAFLMYGSFSRLVSGGGQIQPGLMGFWAIGYTLFIDIFRVVTLSIAEEKGGVTVKASLYHAFGDMASTVVALVGFYLAAVVGISQGDALGSIILSIILAYLSIGLMRASGMELSDAISKKVVRELRRQVMNTRGVLEYKELKARKVGSRYFVDTTIVVPGRMGIREAHEIATKIESNIGALLGDVAVTVHVEPSVGEESLESKVENLASAVRGVEGVHGVSISYSRGSLYITLHAQVDGKLPLEEAHRIAERIEQELHRELSTAKITVHLEPFDYLRVSQKCPNIDLRLEDTVRQVIGEYPEAVKMKTVTTYVSGERRYINLDLILDGKYSIEEAHEIVSNIERELTKRFEKTVVTIHSEPSQTVTA